MIWTQLLASGVVKKHKTSKQELEGIRGIIDRDLADASLSALSTDRRFATAYNAALQTAKMALACAGYRGTQVTTAPPGGSTILPQGAIDSAGEYVFPYSLYQAQLTQRLGPGAAAQ